MSACGGHSAGLTPGWRGAFTIIEVLISLAVLAIALTVLAALIPAGAMTQRKTTRDIEALITINNTAAIYNGKRFPGYAMTCMSSSGRAGIGPYPRGTSGVNGGQLDMVSYLGDYAFEQQGSNYVFSEVHDAEQVVTGLGMDAPHGDYGVGSSNLKDMPSWFIQALDNNGNSGLVASGGYFEVGDLTVVMDKNGVLKDSTNYDAGRIGANHRRCYNLIQGYPAQDLSYPSSLDALGERRFFSASLVYDQNQNVNTPDYWLAVFVMSRGDASGTWPEKAITIKKSYECSFYAGGGAFSGTHNPPALLKDKDGNAFMPDGSDAYNVGNCWRTSSANTDGVDTPTIVRTPACVYDYDKNIIRILYTPCYWQKGNGNPDGVDRRLKPGDKFMPFEGGGTVFTVVSAANVTANPAPAANQFNPDTGATILQDVTVYPPLNSTMLGRNTNPPTGEKTWKLSRIYFAPPSTAGGPSPCVMIRKVHCDRAFSFSPND